MEGRYLYIAINMTFSSVEGVQTIESTQTAINNSWLINILCDVVILE
jgi:hypothetical protein